MSTNPLGSFDLGGGGNSFAFETIGDSVTGKITSITELQQTDMDSGQPAVWENGQPKMMVAVELATTLHDPTNPADDGKRTVYLKGSRKPETKSSLAAVLVAVRTASGATTLNVGGTLSLTYSGDGVPSRRGYNAPKQYDATYVAPAAPSVDLGGGSGVPAQQPAQQPAPVVQAPAQLTAEQQAAFAAWAASQGQPAQQPA